MAAASLFLRRLCEFLRRCPRDTGPDLERHHRTAKRLEEAVRIARQSGNFAADMTTGRYREKP